MVPTGRGPVGSGSRGMPIRADAGPAADAVEPGDALRGGASDTTEPDAEAQEVAATKASRAATVVAPRLIRRGGVDGPPPTPAPGPEAGLGMLSLSIA
ncbi:hypothetical protein Misp03_49250 [Microbispora sp. NBRC 16548]|nr:hypothetical protein Misp03_49250 [Microbispora sp. NBRC 16548]